MLLFLAIIMPVPKLTSHCSNISNGKCSQWRSTVCLVSAHVNQKVRKSKKWWPTIPPISTKDTITSKQWWSQYHQYQHNYKSHLILAKLKSSLRKFCGRHYDLLNRYGIYVSDTPVNWENLVMVLFWPILAPKCEVPKLNTPKYVTLQKLTAKMELCLNIFLYLYSLICTFLSYFFPM